MPAPNLARLGIDDALRAVGVAPNTRDGQDARAMDALRRVSASVDHVERRTSDALKRGPKLDREQLDANAADLRDAGRLADVLRVATRAADHLIAHMSEQVGADYAPPADPKLADLEATLGLSMAAAHAAHAERDRAIAHADGLEAKLAAETARADAAEADLHRHMEEATKPVADAVHAGPAVVSKPPESPAK